MLSFMETDRALLEILLLFFFFSVLLNFPLPVGLHLLASCSSLRKRLISEANTEQPPKLLAVTSRMTQDSLEM